VARLFRVIVPVTDIERATRFYAALLEQGGARVSPGRHYFNCDGVVLACYDPQADGDDRAPTPLTEPLYLAVDDLDASYARARAAGAAFPEGAPPDVGPLAEIVVRPWGERSFYAADPSGNPLCLVDSATVFTG
jgi:catechol 2,3-dioxygenase-like lactoylglutathione lyase family enzyme